MEDTLREVYQSSNERGREVLILVLMEDTLRVVKMTEHLLKASLNPCFNGRYS